MQYVGMDVHWRQTTICILDENGRRVKMMNVRGPWQKVLEELGRIEGAGAVISYAVKVASVHAGVAGVE